MCKNGIIIFNTINIFYKATVLVFYSHASLLMTTVLTYFGATTSLSYLIQLLEFSVMFVHVLMQIQTYWFKSPIHTVM